MKFKVVLKQAEGGGYNVITHGIECFTQGDTIKEALENAEDVIKSYIEANEKINIKKLSKKDRIKTISI